MRRTSEVDLLDSDDGEKFDSDFSEIGEIVNVSSDDEGGESDSIEGFVNIRPGTTGQNADTNGRKNKMILREIHY